MKPGDIYTLLNLAPRLIRDAIAVRRSLQTGSPQPIVRRLLRKELLKAAGKFVNKAIPPYRGPR